MLSNYNIKYICTIYARLDTCLMSIFRLSKRDKVALRLLKLHFNGADVVEWSRALSDWCCSINGERSNPFEGRTNISHLKNIILTLSGLIFRRIYSNVMDTLQKEQVNPLKIGVLKLGKNHYVRVYMWALILYPLQHLCVA